MLNGLLQLHDIRDVESFTARIIQRQRFHPDLQPCDREDLHAWLIATCWELSLADPQPWRRSFSGWVTPLLQLRIVDWQRNKYGRTTWQFDDHSYSRDPRITLSLDRAADRAGNGDDPRRLGDLVAVRHSSDAPDHRATLAGLDAQRNRARTRDLQVIRRRMYSRTARTAA